MASVKAEMFDECMNKINEKFDTIEKNIGIFKNDFLVSICDIKNEVKSEIQKLLNNVTKMVDMIEERVDCMERELIACDMVVSGVPIVHGFSSDQHVSDICKAVGYSNTNNIIKTFRLPHKLNSVNKPSPIVVKFRSRMDKSTFFIKYKEFGGLKLANIGLDHENRIFCNDGLTKVNSAIFRSAKQLQFDKSIIKAFTNRGLVYISTGQDNEPILIKKLDQLMPFSKPKIAASTSSASVIKPSSSDAKKRNTTTFSASNQKDGKSSSSSLAVSRKPGLRSAILSTA